jgi:hypothetical protein
MFLARSAARSRFGGLLNRRSIFIQTVETPNADSLMFYPQIPLLKDGGSADFPSLKAAAKSPLARTLFALDGVTGVFISGEFVTINKRSDVSWNALKPACFETLMDFFASGKPIIEDGAALRTDTAIHEDDDEIVIMIKS